jgi:hypothetical protein
MCSSRRSADFYVSCREGAIDVCCRHPSLEGIARVPTSKTGRTSIDTPQLDRRRMVPALDCSILVFHPSP